LEVELFAPLANIESYRVTQNTVRFRVNGTGQTASVEIGVYRGGLVRYRLFPREPAYDLTDATSLSPVELAVTEENDLVCIRGDSVRVHVHKEPWRVKIFREAEERALIAELPDDVDARENFISDPTGYATKGGVPRTTRINLALDPSEALLGLGEKHTALDKRGQRLSCWNTNPYGAGRETAYKNIPFLASTRGYGLFLNETCRSDWDVGAASNFSLSIAVDGPSFDLFVLVAKGLPEVLGRYADLTGHAFLPPRWSFGLWISPFGEQRLSPGGLNQNELLALADEIRSREIPCDLIHLDPYWMGDEKLCHFQWDRERYPDPAGLVAALREKGMRVCLWEHPYLEKGGEIYEEAARAGFLLKHADGSVYDTNLAYVPPGRRSDYAESFYAPAGIVDFSNPAAVEWYKTKHRPHLAMGVAAFKSDFGEMIPEDAVFANGLSGREMHNLYPMLYNRCVFEVIGEFQDRPIVWGRSGYAGSQRYPVQWSGDPLADFRSLAATIRAGLSYGLSGVPFWTFDLGGFKGQPSTEAYVRWAQVGLLLSHSRFHGTTPRLPWYYGEVAASIIRDYVRTRYRLLPYIYAVSAESVKSGLPVMRPLLLEFPEDPASVATELEYLLGPSLLVAPVLNEAGEVDVYLPPGGWYDYFSGQRIDGPVRISRQCALSELPVYVRESALLPFCFDESTVSGFWDPLGIEVFPAGAGKFVIPEEGERPASTFDARKDGTLRTLRGEGPTRKWVLRFRGVKDRPKQVEVRCEGESSWSLLDEGIVQIVLERCASFEVLISQA
jgi:alpha-D-xyloside xylohydrolase